MNHALTLPPETIARYAERTLPRYTSYPTAPHFRAGADADTYREWLGEIDAAAPVSLYVHVPFCRSMCWYCGCNTTVVARAAPVDRYLDTLHREIDWVADALPQQLAVQHLHFGGGTPTLMLPAQFVALMQALRTRFAIRADAEVAIEIDPRVASDAMIAALAEGGVTRASLGVQSFDPQVQQAINRVQSRAHTEAVVVGLRSAGVSRINLDLIYGLPHQTVESCRETVTQALAMLPDRLAVFGYAHVPGFKPHQRRIAEETLPDGTARHAQAEAIAEMLEQAGYVRIGLDHYARPDDELAIAFAASTLHRNFQGYTTDACETLIGLGASSIGRLPQGYVQNAPAIGDYQRMIAVQGSAVAKTCHFAGEDRLRAAVIERLMCDYRADLVGLCGGEAGARALLDGANGLGALVADGLATVSAGHVVEVPEPARPLVRVVAAAFDQYLAAAPARHSRAV